MLDPRWLSAESTSEFLHGAMTSTAVPELYPQYCFHLSPTINKWCHLQVTDILALSSHPGFEGWYFHCVVECPATAPPPLKLTLVLFCLGQDLFFHMNHPIKWVRVAGIVVAIDDFGPWRAYTLDDTSGATIECHINLPKPAAADGVFERTDAGNSAASNPPAQQKSQVFDEDVAIGDIIDVKGTVRVYRQARNIKAEKIVHLRSTMQEVEFWEKLNELRREVLDRPWVLDRRVIRKCRKEAEGYDTRQVKKETGERRDRKRTPMADEVGDAVRPSAVAENHKPPAAAVKPKVHITGLERRPKTKRTLPITGKYDALGL